MDSYEKSLQTLELPSVLALLAAQAVSETARANAMALRPSGDRAVVETRLGETSAAAGMMVVKGSPSFSGVKDVHAALQRADMGGALNTRELLDIAGVLQAARAVRGYGTGDRQDKTCIDYLFSALQANRYLEEKIFTSITGEDEIADSASSELASIRRLIRRVRACTMRCKRSSPRRAMPRRCRSRLSPRAPSATSCRSRPSTRAPCPGSCTMCRPLVRRCSSSRWPP